MEVEELVLALARVVLGAPVLTVPAREHPAPLAEPLSAGEAVKVGSVTGLLLEPEAGASLAVTDNRGSGEATIQDPIPLRTIH